MTLDLVITILIIAFLAFGALGTVAHIGKERTPITPGLAVGTIVAGVLVIAGVLHLYWT